jgi:hypothetical protein
MPSPSHSHASTTYDTAPCPDIALLLLHNPFPGPTDWPLAPGALPECLVPRTLRQCTPGHQSSLCIHPPQKPDHPDRCLNKGPPLPTSALSTPPCQPPNNQPRTAAAMDELLNLHWFSAQVYGAVHQTPGRARRQQSHPSGNGGRSP